jgi:hypothetical protein
LLSFLTSEQSSAQAQEGQATSAWALFKKPADIKKNWPLQFYWFLKKLAEIHLIKNMNSKILNWRIPADFVDKPAEFADKPDEWTVNSVEHVYMSLNRFDKI